MTTAAHRTTMGSAGPTPAAPASRTVTRDAPPSGLDEMAWSPRQVADALHALAARCGLAADQPAPARPARVGDADWIAAAADALGVEAEPVQADYAHLDALLAGGGPMLLQSGHGVLAVTRARGPWLWLLAPDRRLYRWRRAALAVTLRRRVVQLAAPTMGGVLDDVGLTGRRRRRAESALLAFAFHDAPVGRAWIVRSTPSAHAGRQLSDAGLIRQAAIFVICHALTIGLGLVGWWMVGAGALDGRLEPALVLAWVLMLLTVVPLTLRARWARARLSVGVGLLLKRRLLAGALRIAPDAMRRQGIGGLMGQVFEADAIQAMALGTAFSSVMAIIELVVAGSVLALGAGGSTQVMALALFSVAVIAVAAVGYRRLARWTAGRMALTGDLVEQMVAQRTRLVQTRPQDWHHGEDRRLAAYLADARRLDDMAVPLALLGRGWLVVGLFTLAPAFVAGASTGALAVSIGGVLLAGGALATLGIGLDRIGQAVVAWRTVGPLFRAGRRTEPAGDPAIVARRGAAAGTLLDARGLGFRHRPDARPVLDDCDLRIARGDRVLLEGPSGCGKSTLAGVVTGLRQPQSGLMLLGGYDRATLGPAGWRRRVAAAPQFGDNHIFSGTLAFNLLLGCAWPPSPADLHAAEQTCRALGLGPLLDRMPAGLNQQVGETGWPLSHGEKSRVYLARALLQRSDLVVLDESFAALDPETNTACLEHALEAAPSLMVIAHP